MSDRWSCLKNKLNIITIKKKVNMFSKENKKNK